MVHSNPIPADGAGLWTHNTEVSLKPQRYLDGTTWKMESVDSERYKKRDTASLKLDDQKALGVIGKTVKPEFAESIGQAETAAEAWCSAQQSTNNRNGKIAPL